MSSCLMMNHESDEDVDLEALRVAALKSRKPRFPRVNHNNLIPIVPVSVETPDSIKTKIKQEKISPEREINAQDRDKVKDASSAKEDEKTSNFSGSTLENDPDILSMDDKEEEDSLEKLMDQLEAEISGKAPPPSNKSTKSKEKSKQNENDGADDEVELLQVKSGREPKAIIEIRESASPEQNSKQFGRNSSSPKRSLGRRSRSRLRSRSRSFYSGGRSYRRSKSPYWSRSPHKSRSPFRRSRSPYWSSRRTRSKSRSPFRRYRSPGRKRSPFSRFSRSRSRSYGRRRSPWSLSPRRRSKSPFYRDGVLSPRHRNFNSPGRPRRSYTPRDGSKSPRRRSRSPRRVPRHSPYRRSKSPYRPRSPYRRASLRRSQSPFLRRSKSPLDKLNSPGRSPVGKRHSNSPVRRSLERASSKGRSPPRRPGRPKTGRSRSKSPVPFKNRSPLKVVEKNKLDERMDKSRDRDRLGRRHRSLSRENNRTHERRPHKRGNFPSRKRSRSPKPKVTSDKSKPENQTDKESSSVPAAPLDPVLEARKKKFETLGEVDPTVDKKISLKAIKESTENPEEDEDALTINIENNLWDEPEESEDEFESRFKCDGARKNRAGNNRTVLSFRSLREGDASKKALNKPLTDENRRDRSHRQDAWSARRSDRERKRRPLGRGKSEDNDTSKSKFKSDKSQDGDGKKSNRKPIVWNAKDERKPRPESKDNEASTLQTVSGDKNKSSDKSVNEGNKKSNKNSDLLETDDFDKLISDFEKELESDTCFSTNEIGSVASTNQEENRKSRVSVRRDVFEPKTQTTQSSAKPPPPPPRIVKLSSTKPEQRLDPKSVAKVAEVKEKISLDEPREVQDGPEDYIEDDDFVFEASSTREKRGKEEEDKQSDLRAVLSKRRNERLTKVVSLQENMPTRLVQSAFQGLGHSKLKKPISEVQDLELPHLEKNVKSTGVEGRRVLLLHRDKNPLTSLKYTVPEVQPDTTIHQGFPWSKERRKRKLQRQQQDPSEDMDQEEEEERFEVEEEKHFRRFRLKRNITMSSQVPNGVISLSSERQRGQMGGVGDR